MPPKKTIHRVQSRVGKASAPAKKRYVPLPAGLSPAMAKKNGITRVLTTAPKNRGDRPLFKQHGRNIYPEHEDSDYA